MDNLTPKEIADEEMINQAFHELLNDYLATKHRKRVEIITKAFNFANQALKGIKRRSGEPYIMHPIAVASIVCNEIGLGIDLDNNACLLCFIGVSHNYALGSNSACLLGSCGKTFFSEKINCLIHIAVRFNQ